MEKKKGPEMVVAFSPEVGSPRRSWEKNTEAKRAGKKPGSYFRGENGTGGGLKKGGKGAAR